MSQAKLYQYQVCPFCWKARVALALKKANYEIVEVHPLNKKELSFSEYKKVPVFVDKDGQQVNDSTPIMRHIDAQYGGDKIFETEATAIEKENALLDWSNSYVNAIPPLIYNTYPNALKAFDYITQNSNFSWHQKSLIKYSGALAMKIVAKKSREKLKISDPQAHLVGKLNEWSRALEGYNFAGGDKPNGADAAVFGLTMSLSSLPAAKIVEQDPAFEAWLNRMQEQSGIRFVK